MGREFHRRGWVLGTSGNFSQVVSRRPLRLAVTVSGCHKGDLGPEQVVEVDEGGEVTRGEGRPSSETSLHLAVIRRRDAAAVLHTHSVWATVLSEERAAREGIEFSGFEMLKGLEGVSSPERAQWIPILENAQDREALAATVATVLDENPQAHGFLLRGHGLYTWGRDLAAAKRHVEVLEFLLEVVGRSTERGRPGPGGTADRTNRVRDDRRS